MEDKIYDWRRKLLHPQRSRRLSAIKLTFEDQDYTTCTVVLDLTDNSNGFFFEAKARFELQHHID